MKEEIIGNIDSIRQTMNNIIYPLKDELKAFDNLNYYWDVLEFLIWVKDKHPEIHEEYDLQNRYDDIIHFGYYYLKTFGLKTFIYEDGILLIDKNIEQMILELYDFALTLNEPKDNVELNRVLQYMKEEFSDFKQLITERNTPLEAKSGIAPTTNLHKYNRKKKTKPEIQSDQMQRIIDKTNKKYNR